MLTDKTNYGLVRHVQKFLALPTVYLWGGLGQILSLALFHEVIKRYPDYYTEKKQHEYEGFIDNNYYALDCSGLIKNYLMNGENAFRYNPAVDYNSKLFIEKSTTKGAICSLPEIPGICLYLEGHVGVYIGNGDVIEATNNPDFGNGVIKSRLNQRNWEQWFYCPHIKYED